MTEKILRPLILLSIVLWTLAGPAVADPADWGESDWYKYIEMTVTLTMDKVHGGLRVPVWMKNTKPVGGRLPLIDAYSALSATSSAVKPGLRFWLERKIEEATLADDWDRVEAYQAYRTALVHGDSRRLRELQRKAQAALDKAERDKASQALILNSVLANASPSRQVEVVAQFTVGGNSDESLKRVIASATVQGPKTGFKKAIPLRLSKPSGYQASQFYLTLPGESPAGRYSVELSLSDSRGLASDKRTAFFELVLPEELEPEPELEPGPELEPEPELEPVPEPEETSDPGGIPRGETPSEPTTTLGPLSVQIVAPPKTQAGKVVHLVARVNDGTPPYSYAWSTDGKRWNSQSVTLDYDTPGSKPVTLRVRDSRGAQGTGTAFIQVNEGIAVNISGPREVSQGRSVTFRPVVVTGPSSGFEYSWVTEGQQGTGASFSPTYQTPGRKELICLAKHPDHPLYQSRAYITVTEADDESEPLSVGIIGPTKAEQGQVVAFTPQVKGGHAPFRYTWTVKGKTVSKKSIKGSYQNPGQHKVVLTVVDNRGTRAQAGLLIRVAEMDSRAGIMVVGIQGPDRATVGRAVSFSPSLKGGVGPYRYVWRVEGKTVEKRSIRGKFDSEGARTVELAVYDSSRWKQTPVRASKKLSVTSSQEKTVPTDGRPVTFDEFVGRYRVNSMGTSYSQPFRWDIVFRADGVMGQDRGGTRLVNDARWSINNGILTVEKSDGSDYWNYRKSGRITRAGKGFIWEYTSNKFNGVVRENYSPTTR